MKKKFSIAKGEDIDDMVWDIRDYVERLQDESTHIPWSKGDYDIIVEIKKIR